MYGSVEDGFRGMVCGDWKTIKMLVLSNLGKRAKA